MAAPIGNQNARKKPWKEALNRAVAQHPAGDVLFRIATQMIDKALQDGDQFAIRELAERMDGKSVQATELSGPDGGPLDFRQATDDELNARIAELAKKLPPK